MNKNLRLNIEHPQTSRMEAFLRGVKEPLSIIPFNWECLELKEEIEAGVKLISSSANPVTITIFFCSSYHACNQIAKSNQFPYLPNAKWSLNGDLLYIVESDDEEKVTEILGLFAGEE